jgi:hypothetical protein
MGILIGGAVTIPVSVQDIGHPITRLRGRRAPLHRAGVRRRRDTDHRIDHQIMEGRRATVTLEAVDHPEVETQATRVVEDRRVEVTQVIPEVEDHREEAIHRAAVIPEEEDRPEAEILLEVATRIREDQTRVAIRRFSRSNRARRLRAPRHNRAAHLSNR